jgi:hypothetical protein
VGASFDWPGEKLSIPRRESHQNEAGAELWDTVVRRLENLPLWLVAEFGEFREEGATVWFKLGGGEAWDVLEKDGAGVDVLNQFEGGGEHVAVVVGAELFAGDAEWRAWYARSKQVDAGEILVTEVADILLLDVPLGAVLAEGCAVLGLVLDGRGVVKPGHFEAESLATATCTQF